MGDDKVIPVRVAVRIRPINKKEKNEGCQTALEVVENEPQVRKLPIFLLIYTNRYNLRFTFLTRRRASHMIMRWVKTAPMRSSIPRP